MRRYIMISLAVVGLLACAYYFIPAQARLTQQTPVTAVLTETSAQGTSATIVDIPAQGDIRIGVSARSDPNLALFYAVHDLLREVGATRSSQDDRQLRFARICDKANSYKSYIDVRHLDGSISVLFDDCIALTKAITAFVNAAEAIEKGAVSRQDMEQFATSFSAGRTGGSVAAEVRANGGSGTEAAVAGLAIGIFQYLLEENQRSEARDAAKREAFEQLNQQWTSYMHDVDTRREATAQALQQRYGWSASEVNMNDPPEEETALNELVNKKPSTTASLIIERRTARRPRDATMLARLDNLSAYDARLTPSQKVELAKRCLSRAALLPQDAVFDSDRARIAMFAGDIASAAWAQDLAGRVWHEDGSQFAVFAVRVWDTALRYDPLDLTGECRERRAWSLLGSRRVDDAVVQADEVVNIVGNQFRFAYNYAMAKSAQGDQDTAFNWFKRGVHDHGYAMIERAMDDKNLRRMKAAHKDAYQDLIAVKCDWGIRYGLMNDDIYVVNNSAFALTNVTLTCTLKQGGRVWSPVLKVASIPRGQEYVWRDCVSIPGSRLDARSASVQCDQGTP